MVASIEVQEEMLQKCSNGALFVTSSKMGKSCKGLFDELVRCLSNSECVKNHPDKKTALKDCAKSNGNDVSDYCKGVKDSYYKCRRAAVRSCFVF